MHKADAPQVVHLGAGFNVQAVSRTASVQVKSSLFMAQRF